jgi:hypothetical protein
LELSRIWDLEELQGRSDFLEAKPHHTPKKAQSIVVKANPANHQSFHAVVLDLIDASRLQIRSRSFELNIG